MKKYAAINGMEVEDFIKKNCLTHCLQQMESIQGQESESSEHGGRSAKSENKSNMDSRKIELKNKPTSKDLLDGPLVLDQQCIMDLFSIKQQFCNTSNNKIITVALKLGLNQLSVAIDMLKNKLEK